MLSQGHMGAPLYPYTIKVGPRFWNLSHLWTENDAILSWSRLTSTSHCFSHPCNIYKMFLRYCLLSQGLVGAPLYRYTSLVSPRFQTSVSLVEWKWCRYMMVEADIHLRLLPKSELDISKVSEPLICCRKGIWVHSHTDTQAKFAQAFGLLGHLWSGNDAIISWLRLISTSDHCPHPYYTYTMCLRYWYSVSRAYGCTLVSLCQQSWPQILGCVSFVD